jgi:hypothetical protein
MIQPVRVSANARHLECADGTPFLWIGDTAWELTHRLTRDEIEHYLQTRAKQGFTVIQTVILAELDGLNTPTPEGLLPLELETPELETLKPNPDYLEKIDWMLQRALEHGLTVALLPTWGDKVQRWWGVGPEILAPENDGANRARAFGKLIAERFKHATNLVWVVGGDRGARAHTMFPDQGGEAYARVWQALAEGVRAGDGSHLMAFHPYGGQSSSNEPLAGVLDFNMLQSGHHLANPCNWQMIRHDLETQGKPSFDGEPCYEDMPIDMLEHGPRFRDREVRIAAYHGIFAGAFGHTYGANSVWQFHAAGREPPQIFAKLTWQESLRLPFAATQIRHFRTFLEMFPPSDFEPDWNIVFEPGEGRERVLALRNSSQILVFTPTGLQFKLGISSFRSAKWFDTRTGNFLAHQGTAWIPPTLEDWILVLDHA